MITPRLRERGREQHSNGRRRGGQQSQRRGETAAGAQRRQKPTEKLANRAAQTGNNDDQEGRAGGPRHTATQREPTERADRKEQGKSSKPATREGSVALCRGGDPRTPPERSRARKTRGAHREGLGPARYRGEKTRWPQARGQQEGGALETQRRLQRDGQRKTGAGQESGRYPGPEQGPVERGPNRRPGKRPQLGVTNSRTGAHYTKNQKALEWGEKQ